jgi:aminoglycoside 3-N-acetyltransferase
MYSIEQLANDFRSLGIEAGDTVMLHASVRAVGEAAGGPDAIHLALKSALTPEGTLMMYAGCPRFYDEVGRGNLTLEQEGEIHEKLPAFDPLAARSDRDNGAPVEFLRTYPDSRVNRHVARFVCWGKQTEHLFESQPWNYAYGADSALERFLLLDGKIVLLGSDHDAVTFLHYAEHIADIPGRRVARYQLPVIENGCRLWRAMEEFDTSGDGAHVNWPDRFFAKIVDSLLVKTGNNGALVGNAKTHLLNARELFDFALPVMEAVAADPLAARSLMELSDQLAIRSLDSDSQKSCKRMSNRPTASTITSTHCCSRSPLDALETAPNMAAGKAKSITTVLSERTCLLSTIPVKPATYPSAMMKKIGIREAVSNSVQ